jgi:hypothetical protein
MKAGRIQHVDGERSVAALGAPNPAGEPRAGAASGFSEGCVDDLDEFGIARREAHELQSML